MKLAFTKEYDDNIGSGCWKIFQKDCTVYPASKYILQNSVVDSQKIWGKTHFASYAFCADSSSDTGILKLPGEKFLMTMIWGTAFIESGTVMQHDSSL